MNRRTWTVSEGDGVTLGDVVKRAGGDAEAIAEGRVFVGKIRGKRADEKIRVGDRIEISSPQKTDAKVTLIHRDQGIVVIDKPSGVSTIPDHGGIVESAIALAARAVGVKMGDLHPTSRLDRDVSGVVIFARTKKAAADLLAARARGDYVRRYVGIATTSRSKGVDEGMWNASIGRARDPKLRAAFDEHERAHDAKPSLTRYRVVARVADHALFAFAPETGRTHQIRVHASHAGAPLLGDRAYGGATRVTLASGKIMQNTRIYLHCASVVIKKSGKFREFSAPLPQTFRDMWGALGGDAAAWDTALACEFSPSSR